jgi:esterase/lipase
MKPTPETDRHEIAVLVHGLIRRSFDLYIMGKFLCKNGFTVYVYDYKTSEKTMAAQGVDLRSYLAKIMREYPENVKINIVTHSMGGILTRYALTPVKDKNEFDISRIRRIVMIAPPHGGSNVARFFVKYLPFTGRWLKPLSELSNASDSVIHSVPHIAKGPEIGIIAAKYDREVAFKDTYLPEMKERCVIRAEHSFVVYLKSAHKTVLRFLKEGTFS